MNRTLSHILALCLVLALCLSCGGQAFAATTAASKPTADAVISDVKKLIEDKKYYDAALKCNDGLEDYPASKKEFSDLWDQIAEACEKDLPKTGELQRTFQYQGGNELNLTAKSGNVEMLVRDVSSKEIVRFFIRENETIKVYVPAGEFELSYKVGDIWFDDTNGFGDFCDSFDYSEHLIFPYTSEGGWVTYYIYTDEL